MGEPQVVYAVVNQDYDDAQILAVFTREEDAEAASGNNYYVEKVPLLIGPPRLVPIHQVQAKVNRSGEVLELTRSAREVGEFDLDIADRYHRLGRRSMAGGLCVEVEWQPETQFIEGPPAKLLAEEGLLTLTSLDRELLDVALEDMVAERARPGDRKRDTFIRRDHRWIFP